MPPHCGENKQMCATEALPNKPFTPKNDMMRVSNQLRGRVVISHPKTKAAVIFMCFLVFPNTRAWNQIISGTIVVVSQSSRRVIIAADSRGEGNNNGTLTIASISDCDCKIVALGRDAAFTSAGIFGDVQKTWNVNSEAQKVYSARIRPEQRAGSTQGDLILKSWSAAMQIRFARYDAKGLLAYENAHGGELTEGLFAGIQDDGMAWVRAVRVRFDGTKFTEELFFPEVGYLCLGNSEIVHEFMTLASPRAIAEQDRWKKIKLGEEELDRFKTRRLVELTIKYDNDPGVGGPIDEIELDASGARWLHIKKNCQGD